MLTILHNFPNGLIGKKWDYEAMSGNISLPLEFVDKNPSLNWDWCDIIHHPNVGCQFIITHLERFLSQRVDAYYALSCCSDITSEVIDQLSDKLDYVSLSRYANPEFLDLEKICWYSLSSNSQLSLNFIEQYRDRLYWNFVSSNAIFVKYYEGRSSIIDRLIDNIDWNVLSSMIELDEETLIKYLDRWNSEMLVINRSLTYCLFKTYLSKRDIHHFIPNSYHLLDLELINKYDEVIDWDRLSQFSTLSIPLIDELKDKLKWSLISINESLTQELIDKYVDLIHFDMLVYNPSLTVESMKKYWNRLDRFHLSSHPNLTIEVIDYIEEMKRLDVMELDQSEEESSNSDSESNLNYWRWSEISKTVAFTELYIHKYRHDVDWYNLSRNNNLQVTAIIKNPWLPWDNRGLSVRNYPMMEADWIERLTKSIDEENALMEIRPVIYQWEMKSSDDRFIIGKRLRDPNHFITLIKEHYPIQLTHKPLQGLITQLRDSDALLLVDHCRVSKILRVKKNTCQELINRLEVLEIPYMFRIESYTSISNLKKLESGLTFSNINNKNDLVRNYLDWRGMTYKMRVGGYRAIRPSYIDNPNAEIQLEYKLKTKNLTYALRDQRRSKPKAFSLIVEYDVDMQHCTKKKFDSYWSALDITRVTNYRALEHIKSLGMFDNLFSKNVADLQTEKSHYVRTKIMGSIARLAWYYECVERHDVIKIVSMLCFNQELNGHIFNVLLILALRGKLDLLDYSHLHSDIEHLVSVKA